MKTPHETPLDKQTNILYRIVLPANINWSKLTFLFILSVLKRIQIYPKLQTWLVLSTVAGEHVQVIRDTQKNCQNRELKSRTGMSAVAMC
jgi:hypothetical protein